MPNVLTHVRATWCRLSDDVAAPHEAGLPAGRMHHDRGARAEAAQREVACHSGTLSPYSPGRTRHDAVVRRGVQGGVDRGRVVGHERRALEQPEVLERRPAAKAELPGDVVEHVGGKGGGSHGMTSGGVDGAHALTRGVGGRDELGRVSNCAVLLVRAPAKTARLPAVFGPLHRLSTFLSGAR